MVNNEANLQSVKELLGHESLTTTEVYPVVHSNDKNFFDYMKTCKEIEDEFKKRFIILKNHGVFEHTDEVDEYAVRVVEGIKNSKRKSNFIENISNELVELPIYRKYFISDIDSDYPDNDILCADSNIPGDGFIIFSNEHLITEIFHYCFIELCLDIDDVEKIYELCDYNAEKFKRVILFLRDGNLESFDFRINLYSDDTIPFFDDDIIEDEIPNYDSSMVIISEVSTSNSIRAWHRFCDRQSESFDKKHYAKLKEIPKVAVKK